MASESRAGCSRAPLSRQRRRHGRNTEVTQSGNPDPWKEAWGSQGLWVVHARGGYEHWGRGPRLLSDQQVLIACGAPQRRAVWGLQILQCWLDGPTALENTGVHAGQTLDTRGWSEGLP